MKGEIRVEIDVDGVLGNMDGNYGKYVADIMPDFTEEKYVHSWGVTELEGINKEAYTRIRALHSDPNFIRDIPRYAGVEQGLQRLHRVLQGKGVMVVHTHIPREHCKEERAKWLEKLQKDTGVPFEMAISGGEKKPMRMDSHILIEDNPNNLKSSNAPYKIMVRRGHNRYVGLEAVGEYKKATIVQDFNEAVQHIEEWIRKEHQE